MRKQTIIKRIHFLILAAGLGMATPAMIRGTFKFELEHGVEHEGQFEAPLARPSAT